MEARRALSRAASASWTRFAASGLLRSGRGGFGCDGDKIKRSEAREIPDGIGCIIRKLLHQAVGSPVFIHRLKVFGKPVASSSARILNFAQLAIASWFVAGRPSSFLISSSSRRF